MKISFLNKILSIFTLVLLIGAVGSSSALAQGKGKGGGGGGGNKHGGGHPGGGNKGGGNPNKGGGNPWAGGQPGGGNSGGWKQQHRAMPQMQRQVFRQQMPQVVMGRGNGNGRGQFQQQHRAVQRHMPQVVMGRGNGNGRGQWKQQEKQAQRVFKHEQKQQRQAWKQDRRIERQARGVPFRNGGFVPPGQLRKQEVHTRNAIRKADRQALRGGQAYSYPSYEQYIPRYTPQYAPNYVPQYVPQYDRQYSQRYSRDSYYQDYPRAGRYTIYDPYAYSQVPTYYYQVPVSYAYDPYAYSQYAYMADTDSWKEQLIYTLISSVLSNVLGGDNGYYDDRYYADDYGDLYAPQYDPYYFRPTNYDYGYSEPSYYSFYGRGYDVESSYSQSYGYQSASFGSSYDTGFPMGVLFNAFPIEAIIGQYGRNPYISDDLSNCVAQGYYEGYQTGLMAREYGYDEAYAVDPYVYENGVYDPYSITIGERRRLLSEGYELGYRDAMEGTGRYDISEVGSTDLVSVLLGSVLQQVM